MSKGNKIKTKSIVIKYLLLSLFLLVQINKSLAELHFKNLTVNDGLSQHDASCIIQDSHGFIWIGTYDGLNRFDGYNIKNYNSLIDDHESISGNRIISLFEDSQKRLWIGTDGEGLNYYDLKTERFVRVETPSEYKVVTDFLEDKNGDILVATSKGLLAIKQSDPQLSPELLQLPLTGIRINKMAATGSGIYFATNNGVWHMKNDVCQQIKATENLFVRALTADNDEKIWIGGQGFLSCIKSEDESFDITHLDIANEIEFLSLCTTVDNAIWAGSFNHGLYSVDAPQIKINKNIVKQYNQDRSLLSNSILSLYCDNSNTLWIANRIGVCYASLSPMFFKQIPINIDPFSSQHVRALLYNKGNIYFGVQSGDCYQYNVQKSKTTKLELPKNIFPNHFFKFDNQIYLTSNLGMFRSEEKSVDFKPLSIKVKHLEDQIPNIFSMCRDHAGNYYYGTYDGLIIQTENECDWAHYLFDQAEMLRGKRIFTLLYDDSSNCIWVGTISEGIYKINLNGQGEFRALELYNRSMTNNYQLNNNTIWCFYKDKNENICVCTDAVLLLKKKESNVFTQLDVPGIINRKIMAIIEDNQGNLWLSNSQGIIFYSPE